VKSTDKKKKEKEAVVSVSTISPMPHNQGDKQY
jgi:hypothetical protein